jgi:hypothetical protein
MPKKLIEEIILKVGIDATGVASGLAKLDADLKSIQIQFGKTEKATESNTAAQKKAIPVAKQTGLAMSSLDKELDKTEDGWRNLSKALKKYEKDAKKANKSSGLLSGGIGKLGAVVGVGAAIAVVTDRITQMTETAQDADRLGVVTQNLANLQGVGKTFGATAEDVTQGIKNINESASEALADGKGEKFDLFKELNIDLVEFNKLKPDEQLESFSRSINGVENQGRRTAIQLALMGEEGFKLSTTMDELATNAEGAKAAVEKLTGTMKPETIKQFNQNIAIAKQRLDGFLNVIINQGAEAFNEFVEIMHEVGFALSDGVELANDWNDTIDRQTAAAKKLMKQREEAAKNQEIANKKELKDQKELSELIKSIQENEFKDPKRLGGPEDEGSLAIQRQFKERQKSAAADKAAQDKKDAALKKSAKEEAENTKKNREKAIKGIAAIGLARKKEFIKRLEEESKRGGPAGLVESGSVEEAEINASLASRSGGIDRITSLKNEVSAEERKIENEKLKTLKAIRDGVVKNKSITVNTGTLSG